MENSDLNDSVINALSLLKRVHRLSGSVAILRGKLIHAEVSLKAFSSERFTTAVQSIFDGFARRKRRAQRVALIFEGQNLVLIGRGPMVVGFFFENIANLDTVEAGIDRFIEQFGTSLQMDEPEVDVEEIEVESLSPPKTKEVEPSIQSPKSAAVTRTVITGSPQLLKKIEVEDDDAGDDGEEESSPDQNIPAPEVVATGPSEIFKKILPHSVASTMTTDEILAAIPDRRIRRMIMNEINDSAPV